MNKRILTGITPSGVPHLGNYVGAIRPAISVSQSPTIDSFFFLSDYHALIKCKDPKIIHEASMAVAATWLACGLDPDKVFFYRQSDIPEVCELNWILTTCCAKGLMNRAHAYKAAVEANASLGLGKEDHAIEMGLYCYPILMAADILLLNANSVPVGKDQVQHIEITRDIADCFNHRYQSLFTLPTALIDNNIPLLTGLDGRKMSKSYNNTIPLLGSEKQLRKAIMKIVTNSKLPGEPKEANESALYDIYCAFASEANQADFRQQLLNGMAWGEAKSHVFEAINKEITPIRDRYDALIENPEKIEQILQEGAVKVRELTQSFMQQIRKAVGLRGLDTYK